MSLILEFESLLDSKCEDVCKILIQETTTKIKKLGIHELVFTSNGPLITGNGVYIFFSPNGEVHYIGKAEKRCFVERIPSHFDPRGEAAWFNTLSRKLVRSNIACSFADALIKSLEYSVRLINFSKWDNLTKYCSKFERLLRKELSPCLNPISPKARKRMNTHMELSLLDNLNLLA